MAIFKTPYDTTAGAAFRVATIVHDLRAALTAQGLSVHEAVDGQFSHPAFAASAAGKKFQIALVQGGNSFADSVPFFKHPVFVIKGEKEYMCVDVREYGKWDAHQQQFLVRATTDYVWAIKRALLTCVWADGRYDVVRDISNLPAQVYCALISESLARRFALDAAEQATIAVLAGYFYYGLFNDEPKVDEDEKNNLAGKLSKITMVDPNRVFQIIDAISPRPMGIGGLCDVIRAQVGNVALENLNTGTLLQVISGNWFGTNAREIMSMGLEHVPTWVMIVHASLHSQTFKRATLSKMSARFDKRGAGNQFSMGLSALLGGPDGIKDLEMYSTFFGSA